MILRNESACHQVTPAKAVNCIASLSELLSSRAFPQINAVGFSAVAFFSVKVKDRSGQSST